MARVTTIPATISRFTATPINEKKKRRTALPMPVFLRTARSS